MLQTKQRALFLALIPALRLLVPLITQGTTPMFKATRGGCGVLRKSSFPCPQVTHDTFRETMLPLLGLHKGLSSGTCAHWRGPQQRLDVSKFATDLNHETMIGNPFSSSCLHPPLVSLGKNFPGQRDQRKRLTTLSLY